MTQISIAGITQSLATTHRFSLVLAACTAFVLLANQAAAEMYEYDDIGRLVLVTHDDGSTINYRYDAAGNVVEIAKSFLALPPDGTIDTPQADLTITAGDSVNFTATATDPDNNLPLTFRWDFDNAAADSSEEDPGDVTFSAAGTYNVEFHVADTLGLSDPTPARRTITVQAAGGSGGGGGGSSGNGGGEGGSSSSGSSGLILITMLALVGLARRVRRSATVVFLAACLFVATPVLNAAEWSTMESGTQTDIRDVWGSAPDDVFAVGEAGLILHFDGASWSPMSSGTAATLNAVFGTGPNQVWAVGGTANGPELLEFDGSTWSSVAPPDGETSTFIDVWSAGPGSRLWVITGRRAYYREGGAWSPQSFSNNFSATLTPEAALSAISGFDTTTLVVGRPFSVDAGPLYVNFKETDPIGQRVSINGAFGISATDMYVVGEVSYRLTGAVPNNVSSWTRVVPMGNPVDVWGSAADNVFAVGTSFNGTMNLVTHYDGNASNTWTTSLDTGQTAVNAVWGVGPTDVFAVGDQGSIFRYAEGEPVLTSDNFPHSGWLTGNINSHTGELVMAETDFDLGGNIPVLFTRYYASGLDDTRPLRAELGRNWSHSYDWRLFDAGGTVRIYSPRGRRIVFTQDAGAWTLMSDHDVEYRLSGDGANTAFILLEPEAQLMFEFRTFDGRLSRIRDRIGNTLDVQYTPNYDPPTFITDGRGRGLSLQYDANTNLVSVTVASNTNSRRMTFAYDNGNLATATDASGNVTRYSYAAGGSPGRIESVQQPRGNTPVSWRYDTEDRVEAESYADGTSSALFYASGTTPAQIVLPDDSVRGMQHDENGRLVSITDADGFNQVIAYADGGIERITNRLGFQMTFDYSPDHGGLTSFTNTAGRVTAYDYSSSTVQGFEFNDVSTVRYPDGTSRTVERAPSGIVTAVTGATGNRWSFTHDASGNVTSTVMPGNLSVEYGWDSQDRLSSITDLSGNVTNLLYNGEQQLAVIRHPGDDALNRQFRYDVNGRLTAIVNEAGQETVVGYDANSNIETIDAPGMPTITHSYDDLDRLVTTTSPKGDEHSVAYDRVNNTVTFNGPLDRVGTLQLDRMGRPASFAQGNRMPFGIAFNAEGVMTGFSVPDQRSFGFDTAGDPNGKSPTISLNGVEAKLEHDDEGRLLGYIDAEGKRTSQEYDDAHGLVSRMLLQDPFISSRFEYDDFGNVMLIEDPNGGRWERSYATARLDTMTDPLGRITRFDYDERNRVDSIVFPDGMGDLVVDYHPLGFELSRDYSDGTVINYDYDDVGRMTGGNGLALDYDDNGNIDQSNGIAMTYDAADRLETVELAAGRTVTYIYDDRDMLSGVRDWSGDAMSFQHDDTGRLAGITRANGISTSLGYDALGQLSDIEVPGISSINLVRRGDGLVESAQRNVPRPTGITTIGSRTFDHDAASQVNGFAYDGLGRRTADDSNSYDWALSSRLNGYNGPTGAVSFEYDAIGMRTSRTEAGGTVDYVWNYALGLPSASIQRRNGNDERYFVYTPAGDLLYSIEADGSRRYYHFDENGNTLYLTDDSAGVVASYAYSPYGEILLEVDPVDNPFKFLGQRGVMQEGEDGLYYLRARYYDASSARFLSRDPLQGKTPRRINPYQYAQGNPLLFRDPTGLAEEQESESWLGWIASKAVEKASDIVNGGFGVMNVVGANWAHIRNVAARGFEELVKKNDRATWALASRGRMTVHHRLANSALQTRARVPAPATAIGDIAASTKWAIFGGIVTAVIEDSQEYTDTSAGHALGKLSVGGVNTLASLNPYSAVIVGVSSAADAVTDGIFGVRLGAHEVLNTPLRLGTAAVEDFIFHGRGITDPRSSVARFARDLRTNRGGFSKFLTVVGTPGEWLVDHTPIGDVAAAGIRLNEWTAGGIRSGVVSIFETGAEFFFGDDEE